MLGEKSSDNYFVGKKWGSENSRVKMVERVRGLRVGNLSKSNTRLGKFPRERRGLIKKDVYKDYMGISTQIHKEIHKKLFQKKKKSYRDQVQNRQAYDSALRNFAVLDPSQLKPQTEMPRLKPMSNAPPKKVVIPLSYPSLWAKLESEHQNLSPVNGVSQWQDTRCHSESPEPNFPLSPKMSYNFLKIQKPK
jgi:hypothetical protein